MKNSDPEVILSAIPAGAAENYTLVATWTVVKTVTVTESETAVPIKVTDEWLKTNNLETAETDAIQTALNKEENNGLKAWENYVLGLDGSDPDAKIAADAAQGSVSAMPVTSNVDVPPVDTGFKVEYKLVAKDTSGTTVAESDLQPTPDLTADITAMTSADTNVVYYKTVAVITSTDPEKDVTVTVESTNTVGVLKVESSAKTTAIAVPWSSLTGEGDISVSNLVRTATLSEDDMMYAYDTNGVYRAWKLLSDGTWYPTSTSGQGGTTPAPEADAMTVPRGSAVWLERKDTSKPIYLVGQATEGKTSVTLEPAKAEGACNESWNLVAPSGVEEVDIGTLLGENTSDKVIVPTATIPKKYEYKEGTGWGYKDSEVVETNGIKIVRDVFKTDDKKVPAGTGFWYLNGDTGTNKKIDL